MKNIILFLCLFASQIAFAQFECQDFSDDFELLCASTPTFVIEANDIKIYPNPVVNEIIIETQRDKIDIQIYDVQGRLVLLSNEKLIDVSNFAQGMYVIVINRQYRNKFIKI